MKSIIKKILQGLLGFENYLFIFSIFIIYTLKFNRSEKDFLRFLKLIPDGGTVLDLGANIGIMTVHFSWKLPDSKVYSFEPLKINLNVLNRVIAFFKLRNVKIFETALGNENGEVEMVMPVVNTVKMHGLSHVVHHSITEFQEGDMCKVKIKKLDDIEELRDGSISIKAIKLDVENFEFLFCGIKKKF